MTQSSWVGDVVNVVHFGEIELNKAPITYFTPPPDSGGSIKFEFTVPLPEPAYKLQQVTVCSQSRTIELYDETGEYISTIKSQYLELAPGEKEEAVLFQGSASFSVPVTCKILSVKMLSLFRSDKVAMRGLAIKGEAMSSDEIVASKKATESKTAQDMQGIFGMLSQMQNARHKHPAPSFALPVVAPALSQSSQSSMEQRMALLEQRINNMDLDTKLKNIEAKLDSIERLEAKLTNIETAMEHRVRSIEHLARLVNGAQHVPPPPSSPQTHPLPHPTHSLPSPPSILPNGIHQTPQQLIPSEPPAAKSSPIPKLPTIQEQAEFSPPAPAEPTRVSKLSKSLDLTKKPTTNGIQPLYSARLPSRHQQVPPLSLPSPKNAPQSFIQAFKDMLPPHFQQSSLPPFAFPAAAFQPPLSYDVTSLPPSLASSPTSLPPHLAQLQQLLRAYEPAKNREQREQHKDETKSPESEPIKESTEAPAAEDEETPKSSQESTPRTPREVTTPVTPRQATPREPTPRDTSSLETTPRDDLNKLPRSPSGKLILRGEKVNVHQF